MSQPLYSNEDELREAILRIGESFGDWWSEQTSDLNTASVLEIIGHILVHLRQFYSAEEVLQVLGQVVKNVEERIRSGDIILQLQDGTEFEYISAEGYEGREEMREMLIATSKGEAFTDDDIRRLLDDDVA